MRKKKTHKEVIISRSQEFSCFVMIIWTDRGDICCLYNALLMQGAGAYWIARLKDYIKRICAWYILYNVLSIVGTFSTHSVYTTFKTDGQKIPRVTEDVRDLEIVNWIYVVLNL
jgi:hypothetical protein